MRRTPVIIVASILLVALALRIAEVQSAPYKPVNDAGTYLKLAGEIANTGNYYQHDPGAGGTRGPSAYFPPGFPAFLAAVDILDGHTARPATSHPARLSQALLGTVTVALIGLLALELFGPAAAVAALVLGAVYPVLIELSGTLVAENLLTPLVLAATWAVLRARRSAHAYRWLAAAGLLTGLSALTHANALVLLIPFGLAVWTARPRWSPSGMAAPALLLVLTVLTIAPWTIRNAVELHRFIPITDEAGITLAGTYNPASAADPQVPWKWRLYSFIAQDHQLTHRASRMTEPQLGDRLQSQALTYIGDHPLAPVKVAFHNTLRMFELEGSFAWHASAGAIGLETWRAGIGVVSFWILSALALLGAATRLVRRAPWWVWSIPVLLAITVVLVNVETPRFREPIDAFLILPASCALATLAARLQARPGSSGGSPVGSDRETPVPAARAEPVEVVERLP